MPGPAPSAVRSPPPLPRRHACAAAFTLIELMIVVAMMAIIVATGIPSLFRVLKKDAMRQAVSDLVEACGQARAMAILQGVTTEVVLTAGDGEINIQRAFDRPADGGANDPLAAGVSPALPPPAAPDEGAPAPALRPLISGFPRTVPESIAFKELVVNLRDYVKEQDATEARVRFYPNGTCDALRVALFSDRGEERIITLELTTGMADVEVVR